MKSFPSGEDPQRRPGRARRGGQDHLAEALLFCAGAITAQGRVEDGTTTCDFDPEEVKRQHLGVGGPGPLRVAGPQDQPARLPRVRRLRRRRHRRPAGGRPGRVRGERGRGRRGADRDRCGRRRPSWACPGWSSSTSSTGSGPASTAPSSSCSRPSAPASPRSSCRSARKPAFRGVADLLSDTAITYEGGKPTTGAIPDEMEAQEHAGPRLPGRGHRGRRRRPHGALPRGRHAQLRGAGEDPGPRGGVGHGLPGGLRLGGQGHRHRPAGHLHLRDRPVADRAARRPSSGPATHAARSAADPSGQPLAFVFKTLADPYVGKISHVQGAVGHDPARRRPRPTPAPTPTSGCTHLFTLRGKEQVAGRARSRPATSRAVAKLGDTTTGDTLAPKGTPVVGRPPPAPGARCCPIAIRPKSKGDEDKLMTALHRLQEEDPALARPPRRRDPPDPARRAWARPTWPSRPSGCPASSASRSRPRRSMVAYRETITASAEAEGKYKKQTGGHGQFGVAFLRVEPLERGGGFEFERQDRGRRHPPPVHPRRRRRASRRPWRPAASSATRSST